MNIDKKIERIFFNYYGDLRGFWAFLIVIAILFVVIGTPVWLTERGDYEITATYCNANKQCSYRDRAQNSKECPEMWDNSSAFGSVNNLKLVQGTCKAHKK